MRKKSIVELESDMLNGQKLQGPETAAEVIMFQILEVCFDKFCANNL